MNDDNQDDKQPAPAPQETAVTVTSDVTIDFPDIGFAIRAGEEIELPADKAAVLENDRIRIVK